MPTRGFSLPELLIVIGILALIAALSIPAYLDYTVRTRVAEGLNLALTAQIAVVEATTSKNRLPANQAETGFISPAPTENVQSISIANDGSGQVVILFTNKAGGGTLILTPTFNQSEIIWSCTGGTLKSSFRPVSCR